MPISFSLDRFYSAFASHMELWAAQDHPTVLCCRESLPSAIADQSPFLSRKRSEQM
jgi:hypothetical protein